ncbi:MAG: RDD family protein [Lachnospiraceae bacterium]
METNCSKAYAGFFTRLLAYMIDCMISGMVVGMVTIPLRIASGSIDFLSANFIFHFTVVDVVSYVGVAAYFVLLTYFAHATLGKMLLRLQVVTDEKEWTFINILYRETIGRFLSAIFNIGYLAVVVTQKKQGFHDMLCDTYVVYKGMEPCNGNTANKKMEPSGANSTYNETAYYNVNAEKIESYDASVANENLESYDGNIVNDNQKSYDANTVNENSEFCDTNTVNEKEDSGNMNAADMAMNACSNENNSCNTETTGNGTVFVVHEPVEQSGSYPASVEQIKETNKNDVPTYY